MFKFNRKVIKITAVGWFIHFMLFIAVMDIYFGSPIEHGMQTHKLNTTPPANRVVLIVADGLRAESIYAPEYQNRSPHITDIRFNWGSWGVSHTRVPTESRPGHVAIMAGIYEDPSAIFKGWTHNPVNFDSVLNQSDHSWCWGSPDIVNLFKNENQPHIYVNSYDAKYEDFGEKNTSLLDLWVFSKVEEYLNANTKGECKELCDGRNIFFLHLLGLDSAGHAHKPNSKLFVKNVKAVDDGISRIENLFLNTFPDNKTTFIFTSDHGMTDWGSHGDGSSFETETVFVAWGAGIKTDSIQKDLSQVDIAPLISTLIGINIPINSIGKLPYSYLEVSDKTLADALVSNAEQMTEQYKLKNDKLKSTTIPLFYIPLHTNQEFDKLINSLKNNYDEENYIEVIKNSKKIIDQALLGMKYIQKYYRTPLLTLLSLGFIFWLIYLGINIVESDVILRSNRYSISKRFKITFKIIIALLFIVISTLINVQSLSTKIYVYALFPVVMLYFIASEIDKLIDVFHLVEKFGKMKFIKNVLFYFFGIELLMLSFYYRQFLFLLMCILGLWLRTEIIATSKKIFWFITTAALGSFTFFSPLNVSFQYYYFVFVVVVWIYMYFVHFRKVQESHMKIYGFDKKIHNWLLLFKFFLFLTASVVSITVAVLFDLNKSRPLVLNFVSWIVLAISLTLLPVSHSNFAIRLSNILSSAMTIYIMFCINIEGPFMVVLIATIIQWVLYEYELRPTTKLFSLNYLDFTKSSKSFVKINVDNFRRAFFLLSFIIVSFFGTGNIASLSSFNPMWVRCFLTVFSPFTMFGLILIKITLPFFLVICAFRGITLFTGGEISKLLYIILLYCDVMVLQFLFLIKDEGSWKEIGTQLSNFIILELTTVTIMLYYFLAYIITTTNSFYNFIFQLHKSKSKLSA